MDNIKLYFYNGMKAPARINIKDITIDSNYLGDLTDEFIRDHKEMIDNLSIEDMKENQVLSKYDIWINPTIEDFEKYNKSKMLPPKQYIDSFIE